MRAPISRSAAAVVLALSFLLGACSNSVLPSSTPRLDSAFGESVRQVRAAQTIDPEAGRKSPPVAGIDGEAGRSVMQAYQKSFVEPPRTFNILGIGGASVGAGP
jgi:hypothetical protein